MNTKHLSLILAALLVILGMSMRLVPHPWNFTPLTAIALFAGVYLPRRYAYLVPLTAMVVSDLIIGLHDLVLFTWGSFILIGVIGIWVGRHKSVWSIGTGALGGSLMFFLVTNWAVMQFGTMYPHSWAGLVSSYVAGLPFFRNMLLGDVVYTAVVFGLYEAALVLIRQKQSAHPLSS